MMATETPKVVTPPAVQKASPNSDGSHIPKRKTKVSDLISRLSSSTVASRAKYEQPKVSSHVRSDSTPRSFRHVFRSRASTGSVHQQSSLTSPSTTPSSLPRSRHSYVPTSSTKKHSRTQSQESESSIFFPKINASSPPPRPPSTKITSPHKQTQGKQPSLKPSPPRNQTPARPGAPVRSQSATQAISDAEGKPTSGTSTPRSASRSTSIPPNGPPPKVLPRPASRQQRVNVRRPVSRAGGRPTNHRVEELRSKISELEDVLRYEKDQREAVLTKVEQIHELEVLLEKERVEKETLQARLASYENRSKNRSRRSSSASHIQPITSNKSKSSRKDSMTGSLIPEDENDGHDTESTMVEKKKETESDDGMAESNSLNQGEETETGEEIDGSEDGDIEDVDKEASLTLDNSDTRFEELEKKVTELLDQKYELEKNVTRANKDKDKLTDRVVDLETELSVLKGDNKTLKGENEYHQSCAKKAETQVKELKSRVSELQKSLNDANSQLENSQQNAHENEDKSASLEKQLQAVRVELEQLQADYTTKVTALEEASKHLKEATAKVEESTSELERANNEKEELSKQVKGYASSRKHIEKQVTTLERENRRSKRIITALETSLQDLKISLEEKAIENDELNRSIVKVMEKANETIEGAKRNSMALASPPLSQGESVSSFKRNSSSSFSGHRISHRSSQQSQTDTDTSEIRA
uniref:ARAD1D42966p n=1 Tax=Blastobotrys adeninivorans TaxID=409370 RepID=A0A060TJ08_BLAAD